MSTDTLRKIYEIAVWGVRERRGAMKLLTTTIPAFLDFVDAFDRYAASPTEAAGIAINDARVRLGVVMRGVRRGTEKRRLSLNAIRSIIDAPEHIGRESPWDDVVAEWWRGEKKLTVYYGPEYTTYVQSWGADVDTDMCSGEIFEAFDVKQLRDWLRDGDDEL